MTELLKMPRGLRNTYFYDLSHKNELLFKDNNIIYQVNNEVNNGVNNEVINEVNNDVQIMINIFNEVENIRHSLFKIYTLNNSLDIEQFLILFFNKTYSNLIIFFNILLKYKLYCDNNSFLFFKYIIKSNQLSGNIELFNFINYQLFNIIYYFIMIITKYGKFLLYFINSNEKKKEFICYQLYRQIRRFRGKNNENIFYLYKEMSEIFQKEQINGIRNYCTIKKIIDILDSLDRFYLKK
jgi:hypothetical protein